MNCFIGLDIGSSSVKVGLIDEHGDLLALANYQYATKEPCPGHKEQDPADWWNAVTMGVREVLGTKPEHSILAVGITGHISSLTFVDAEGMPLRPAIGFQDQRAFAEVDKLAQSFSRAELASRLAIDLPPAPTWPLPKLLWMREHEPKVLERARYLLQAKDYINFQLTGKIASDLSSNRGMVNFANGRPATDIFDQLGLPNILPPLRPPQSVIGRVTAKAARATGLRVDVPVIVGWNDLNACVLGSGVTRSGHAFDVTGTSEHIGIVTDVHSSTKQLICAPYISEKHLLYGVTSSGGGSLQWFRKFSGKSIDEVLVDASAPADGLLFLPYLEGERSPIWDPHASGVLLGIRSVHNQGNVARAILEGVAFSLRQNLDILEAHIGLRPEVVIASGGASRIRLWNQIKASVLKRQIVTLRNPHAGIQGAVILAAVGVGIHSDLETAALAMTHVSHKFDPQPDAMRHMDKMYAIFSEIYPALHGSLSQLSAENLLRRNEVNS